MPFDMSAFSSMMSSLSGGTPPAGSGPAASPYGMFGELFPCTLECIKVLKTHFTGFPPAAGSSSTAPTSAPAPAPSPAAPSIPPRELYKDQLQQLADMGFDNEVGFVCPVIRHPILKLLSSGGKHHSP